MIRLAALFAASGLAIGSVLAAAPAFADTSPPVTATVTVPSSTTISGVSGTVAFPATPSGPVTVTNAETYTVSSTDTAGFTLSIVPSADHFSDPPAQGQILNSALAIKEKTGGTSVTGASWSGVTPVQIDRAGSAQQDTYTEDWTLNIPANTPAGNYSNTFTYTAQSN